MDAITCDRETMLALAERRGGVTSAWFPPLNAEIESPCITISFYLNGAPDSGVCLIVRAKLDARVLATVKLSRGSCDLTLANPKCPFRVEVVTDNPSDIWYGSVWLVYGRDAGSTPT